MFMDYRKLNIRAMILIVIAGLMLLGTIISKIVFYKKIPDQNYLPMAPGVYKTVIPVVESNHGLSVRSIIKSKLDNEITGEDPQSIKDMKEQMDNDRLQQKKIKILKLQLEQTNLQLEQEKALSEISKLEKENAGVVNVATDQGQDKYPDVKVIYIGGTAEKKEAILSINGNDYSVKEKNKPVKNVEVLSITDTGVFLHFILPQDLKLNIEYKPE
jgi:hypothetical protein